MGRGTGIATTTHTKKEMFRPLRALKKIMMVLTAFVLCFVKGREEGGREKGKNITV